MNECKDSTDQSKDYSASDSQSEPRKPFRISERCPRCTAPLVIVAEASEGCNWVACLECPFREPIDHRTIRLIERCMFLERVFLERAPDAPLWEPTEPTPNTDAQRKLR